MVTQSDGSKCNLDWFSSVPCYGPELSKSCLIRFLDLQGHLQVEHQLSFIQKLAASLAITLVKKLMFSALKNTAKH